MNVFDIRKQIISGEISVDNMNDDTINSLRHLAVKYTKKECCDNEEMKEFKELIMTLLDYYTYNSEGNVVISDYDYDKLMENYLINGGSLIYHADVINSTQTKWNFVVHECPGIVGTIKKVYDEAGLVFWWNNSKKLDGTRRFRIAPKFDGLSSAIKISGKGELLQAVTRNDGYKGMDITKVIANAHNIRSVLEEYSMQVNNDSYVWIKTEVVMHQKMFEKCIEEKEYANRRSAAIGIVNGPKNVHLAKYLDILPLAVYDPSKDSVRYRPYCSYVLETDSPVGLLKEIDTYLTQVRSADFPYRVDGIVIYPLPPESPDWDQIKDFNPADIMDSAIAYKVNTNDGLTTVDYGYVSVGPLGYARPMLHVHPVEVNETVVRDVSLGSFDIFANMDLHEGEQVVVFSAGDVIPQARLPENRVYKKKAKLIKIKKRCPFCNEKLIRDKGTYRCENVNCPRVNQGKIINFITKLKVKDVSEATIEDLYQENLIKRIPDIFDLTVEDIERIDGYKEARASLIVSEFQKIKNREITISELLGALGIKGISTKKCRRILDALGGKHKKIFKKNPEKLFFDLTSGEGVGDITASIFIDFIKENQSLINELIDKMNIVSDRSYKGNVVFTGFRDPELEQKFLDIGFEVSSGVNSKTKAVINASYDFESSKCQAAIKRNISIVHRSQVDAVLEGLSHL